MKKLKVTKGYEIGTKLMKLRNHLDTKLRDSNAI